VATVVEIFGWAMATIQENSDEYGRVRDFAWYFTHRARRGGQLIDIVMLVGWVVVVGSDQACECYRITLRCAEGAFQHA
jgi:hypothetical protein